MPYSAEIFGIAYPLPIGPEVDKGFAVFASPKARTGVTRVSQAGFASLGGKRRGEGFRQSFSR
jgi:hypothetical protein